MCFVFRTIFYHEPLSLREISRLSKCSLSKVHRIVKDLKKKKLILIDVLGRSYLIKTNLNNELLKYMILKEEAEYTYESLLKYPELKNVKVDGKIVLIFGSYASWEANELSDIDILTIDGNGKFNISLEEFKDMLYKKNPMILSIVKKHIILKGFEEFVNMIIEWKKNYSGV